MRAVETRSVEAGNRPTSFDTFAATARPGLVRLAWALVGDLDTAEDLAHEAVEALLPTWETVADPTAYCRAVVVNRARSRWRRKGRERRAIAKVASRPAHDVVMPAPSNEVWDAVRELSFRQRVAVVLVVLDDLPLAAVAEQLSCDVETARTHLRRGKQHLAKSLQHLQEDRP
jgi:RNA polymerase sigma factor (sigma-70 family)